MISKEARARRPRVDQFAYINRYYGLSLKPGTQLIYTTSAGVRRHGQVLSAASADRAHIMVRFHGIEMVDGAFHPTWHMEYP